MREGLDRSVGVIGAGHAAGAFVIGLREAGWRGPITVFGNETALPYQRPPLSKRWPTPACDELELRPAPAYSTAGINLRLGSAVTAMDPVARTVSTDDGTCQGFDVLVMATGARPRVLDIPGSTLDGVGALRTLADAVALGAASPPGARLVILGGGTIGLEVAASLRAAGVTVTVVERAHRLLARTASETMAAWLRARHEAQGVVFHLGRTAVEIEGKDRKVSAVLLDDGTRIACDAVLSCVGVEPDTGLAVQAGLLHHGPIKVDSAARVCPGLYAIGDCTSRPVTGHEGNVRLESVPSALEQGRQVIADLCGSAPPPLEVPWFWSDQYAYKLQTAGLVPQGAALVVRTRPGSDRITVAHLTPSGHLLAVEAVGAPGDFLAARQVLGRAGILDPDLLSDPAIPFRAACVGMVAR